MTDTKSPFTSRTFIGLFIAALAMALGHFGYQISPDLQGDLVDLVVKLGEVFGLALAAYGRVKATKAIRLKGGGRGALALMLLAGLAAGGPVACASYTVSQTETATPAQQVYALQGDYNAALELAAGYIASDRADADAVAALRHLDAVAYAALREARTAVRAGDDPTWPAALAAARQAVEALADYVRTHRTQEK